MKAHPSSTHGDVDRRLLRLVEACVERIDADRTLLERARIQASHYSNARLRSEWDRLLDLPWESLRVTLLEHSDEGNRIRQSVPFGGFLRDDQRLKLLTAP